MIGHSPGCPRTEWLLTRPRTGLLWAVLFREGPPCECGAGRRLFSPEQSDSVTQGAGVPPTAVNSQVGGVPDG